ncbi:MAG: hypothetical protein P8I30_04935 [Flavobacteriaceae bacterium]|nr:hypothetical protein [Flavobacteriaceae bacterium]
MKKLIYLPLLSFLFAGVISCETDAELVEIPDSTIQRIADAAAAAVSTPSASEIAAAVESALQDDLAVEEEVAPAEIHHSGFITSDETWSNTSIHVLDNKVIVTDGNTLTIEAGTVIKAANNAQPNTVALIVARGADIYALGSATHPIIMTSSDDDVQIGGTYSSGSPNLTASDNGLWGGLVVLGKARISPSSNAQVAIAEGIEASNAWAEFGGTDDADNSGVIEYVTIKHAGAALTSDNELNQLTLCGVGNGTTIQNIEVYAGSDDGMEFFGGTVGVTNFLAYHVSDDSVDTDFAFSGSVDNAVIIQHPTLSSDHAMELSGRLGTYEAANAYTFSDFTIVAGGITDNVFKLKDNLKATFSGFWVKGLNADNQSKIKVELADWTENADGDVTASDIYISPGTSTGVNEAYILGDLDETTAVKASELTGSFTILADETKPANGGADTSVFGWTFAASQNALSDNGI